MNVVIDTNVLVSALMNPNGSPARILALVLNGKIKMLYDNRILFEYTRVLLRQEFGFESEMVNNLLNYCKQSGEHIYADSIRANFTDESDKKFYEVYKSGKAQYLITGNIRHFPKEKTILTPKDFLEIFET